MIRCKGIVRNNVVELEEGARLPDGSEVEVRVVEDASSRDEAFNTIARQCHHASCWHGRDLGGGQARAGAAR